MITPNKYLPEKPHENKQKVPDFEILKFLSLLPHLHFSDKGIKNLCQRFGVPETKLEHLINSIQRGGF